MGPPAPPPPPPFVATVRQTPYLAVSTSPTARAHHLRASDPPVEMYIGVAKTFRNPLEQQPPEGNLPEALVPAVSYGTAPQGRAGTPGGSRGGSPAGRRRRVPPPQLIEEEPGAGDGGGGGEAKPSLWAKVRAAARWKGAVLNMARARSKFRHLFRPQQRLDMRTVAFVAMHSLTARTELFEGDPGAAEVAFADQGNTEFYDDLNIQRRLLVRSALPRRRRSPAVAGAGHSPRRRLHVVSESERNARPPAPARRTAHDEPEGPRGGRPLVGRLPRPPAAPRRRPGRRGGGGGRRRGVPPRRAL